MHRRILSKSVLLGLVVSLATAAGAQAAVTSSSITSPANPFTAFDQGQTQNVTISGTATGSGNVDIRCYNDNGSTGYIGPHAGQQTSGTIITGVTVSGGSFSTSVPLSDFDGLKCRLRAVPSGTTPTTGLGAFAGPDVSVGYYTPDGSISDGRQYDYYAYEPQGSAADDYDSFGSYGFSDSYLFDPTVFGQTDAIGFYGNDWVEHVSESDPTRAGVEVDGHPAYPPANAENTNQINDPGTTPGFPVVTLDSITRNATNGDLTIVETEPLARCLGDPFPATHSNCTSFIPSGVQDTRTFTQTNDGHTVYVADAFSSTDGKSHALSLLLENDQDFTDASQLGGSAPSYEFPGQASFSAHTGGDAVSVPSGAPASILIENSTVADGSMLGARGAITYAQPPSGPFKFSATNGHGNDVFDAPNNLTVPASGSVSIGYAYSTEFTLAAVQHDALVAQDHFKNPAVTISSPKNGSVTKSSKVTVTGTASAGSGVAKVTVNGVTATLGGGTYSASVPLTAGKDTIIATLVSSAGDVANASETVAYAKLAVKTKGARKVGSHRATLTGSINDHGLAVKYYFVYGRKHTKVKTLKASSKTQKVSFKIKGLSAGQSYRYKLVAAVGSVRASGKKRKFRTA